MLIDLFSVKFVCSILIWDKPLKTLYTKALKMIYTLINIGFNSFIHLIQFIKTGKNEYLYYDFSQTSALSCDIKNKYSEIDLLINNPV
jgi:hypothetical protein